MKHLVTSSLLVTGLIHLIPLYGVLGAEPLLQLYGVDDLNQDLALLLRHRAVLFGLLGVFMLAALFKPSYQIPALVAGWISVVSFVILSAWTTTDNPAIRQVMWIDVVLVPLLTLSLAATWWSQRTANQNAA